MDLIQKEEKDEGGLLHGLENRSRLANEVDLVRTCSLVETHRTVDFLTMSLLIRSHAKIKGVC